MLTLSLVHKIVLIFFIILINQRECYHIRNQRGSRWISMKYPYSGKTINYKTRIRKEDLDLMNELYSNHNKLQPRSLNPNFQLNVNLTTSKNNIKDKSEIVDLIPYYAWCQNMSLMNFVPKKNVVELKYNFLSQDSLSTISIPNKKQKYPINEYLSSWWLTAQKWGILSGKLLQYHNENPQGQVPLELLKSITRTHQSRVICIGDVHGCIDELIDLLQKVEYMPGDLVVFLGDLVFKGPNSTAVIQIGYDLGAVATQGNHDHMLIRKTYDFVHKAIKYPQLLKVLTLNLTRSYLATMKSLSQDEFTWLINQPYCIRSFDLGSIFVHAGINPYKDILNQNPLEMMTMRSTIITRKNDLPLENWTKRWKGPLKVYYGHHAEQGFRNAQQTMGIDTGCVYGGNLTSVIFPNEEIIQVPARKVYLRNKRIKSNFK